MTFQTKDKKFLNELAHDKKYLEKMLKQLTKQKETPSQFQGSVQKQVKVLFLEKAKIFKPNLPDHKLKK